jgi:hypothetical protein
LELVNTLAPGVRIQAVPVTKAHWVPVASGQIFLLNPTDALRRQFIARGARLVAVPLATDNDAALRAFRSGLARKHGAQPALGDTPGAATLWRVRS